MRNVIRKKKNSGQSVVEFALMMPVIMAFFFYIFEANIHMSAMHQGSYASYMGARGFLVERNGRGKPERIGQAILTGKLFKQSGPPASVRADGNNGVVAKLGNMDSLPYTKDLLKFSNEVPTHLGRNEWSNPWNTQREGPNAPPKMYTDNNLRDN
jgi:hypothetical protein